MMVPRESGLHFKPGFSHTAERFICVPFHNLLSLLVCSQPRQEARPNSARCIHFIRSNALRISILIPRTSCCRPQAAYGAEYAVMNNKPQSKPKSVILQPFFFKFDSGSSLLDFCTSLIWSDETRGGTSDAIIQLKEKIWSAVKTVSLNWQGRWCSVQRGERGTFASFGWWHTGRERKRQESRLGVLLFLTR